METGTLYICPTPIGNLGDITVRTLEVLRSADAVYAEDTRVSSRLLAAYEIKKPVLRLDEASISKDLTPVLDRLRMGESIAYCSDAGMPGVSDPGLRLVRAAQEAGIPCEVLPGASAGTTAYVASGFTSQRYYFGAFLPRKQKESAETLQALSDLDAVLVFYESPNRVVASLEMIAKVFPLREVAICRELTKLHEEVVRAPSEEVHRIFAQRAAESTIKGEIVIVIDAPSKAEQAAAEKSSEEAARQRAQELKHDKGYSNKDIVSQLQREYGIARNVAYEIAVNL